MYHNFIPFFQPEVCGWTKTYILDFRRVYRGISQSQGRINATFYPDVQQYFLCVSACGEHGSIVVRIYLQIDGEDQGIVSIH